MIIGMINAFKNFVVLYPVCGGTELDLMPLTQLPYKSLYGTAGGVSLDRSHEAKGVV